ncbi:MAG: hypothetical protein RLY20_3005 [Verrucomicrobiota bacterium]|jgi:hypothetical protein
MARAGLGMTINNHEAEDFIMKTRISFKQLALLISLSASVVGCTPLKSSRTVALPGLPPIKDVNQVRLVERIEDVNQPYQIVGKVTTYREGTRILKNSSVRRISEQAAAMGADGIIGLHNNPGHGLFSAITVKWLAPGESPKPLEVPFIVAVIPPAPDPTAPGNQEKIIQATQMHLMYALESKGYYYLPNQKVNITGGLEGAKLLNDSQWNALGSPNAHALLELAFIGHAKANLLIASGASISIKATLVDKQTKKNLYEGTGTGAMSVGFLLNAMAPNAKREEAAMLAALQSLKNLTPPTRHTTP